MLHPSFPGGRSGSLRDTRGVAPFGRASPPFAGHSCDLTEKTGDGFPSTEYLRLEGVLFANEHHKGTGDNNVNGADNNNAHTASASSSASKGAKNGHPSGVKMESDGKKDGTDNPSSRPNADKDERRMQAELAAAVASGARSHRAKELRDAMYLSVVARHCGLGVPLASSVDAFREDGKRSRRNHLTLRSGTNVLPTGGRSRSRSKAHERKVSRLVRECLPAGADELLERHIDRVIESIHSGTASSGLPSERGRTRAASGLPTPTLARVYSQSAMYGYFLEVVDTRLALEHKFQALPPVTSEDFREETKSRADGYELVSNISSLPAYPSSIGDWIAEEGEEDADLDSETDPAVLEARQRRRDRSAAAFQRAEALQSNLNADDFDHRDVEAELERARDSRRQRQWRRATGYRNDDDSSSAFHLPKAFPSAIGDWVGDSSTGESESESDGEPAPDAEYDEPFYEKPIFDMQADVDAAPNLRAFVDAMDPTLRASLATIGEDDVAAVLDSHVAALFGDASSRHTSALRSAREDGGADDGELHGTDADVVPFDPSMEDVVKFAERFESQLSEFGDLSDKLDVVRMPLDGMRYMVVEAAAFGASLWRAERRCERYELMRRSVDGAKDQSESRR